MLRFSKAVRLVLEPKYCFSTPCSAIIADLNLHQEVAVMPNNPLYSAKTYSGENEVEMGAAMGNALARIANKIAQPFLWAGNTICGWGISLKVKLCLLWFFIFPALTVLVMLESHAGELRLLLAFALMVAIIGYSPLSKLLVHLMIGKDLKEIDQFCTRLKEGDYSLHFELPDESENEQDLLVLKRNLNWMAHVIAHRETWLQTALEGAHKDKSRYKSLSDMDPLTGLANRRCLERRLGELIQEACLFECPLSLMFIDCDKFKSVNDNFGHQAGDQLLQNLADIIRKGIRRHVDLAFRYGGDEFGVVCVGLTADQAKIPAERIRREFLENRLGEATLSIGVAGYVKHDPKSQADNMAKFIKAADKAVYRAKARGGDQVVLAEELS
jgi:two-component system cell cycle response regulator